MQYIDGEQKIDVDDKKSIRPDFMIMSEADDSSKPPQASYIIEVKKLVRDNGNRELREEDLQQNLD